MLLCMFHGFKTLPNNGHYLGFSYSVGFRDHLCNMFLNSTLPIPDIIKCCIVTINSPLQCNFVIKRNFDLNFTKWVHIVWKVKS